MYRYCNVIQALQVADSSFWASSISKNHSSTAFPSRLTEVLSKRKPKTRLEAKADEEHAVFGSKKLMSI